MDATRTEIGYLLEVVAAVVAAGASTVNIPDTVGYTTPEEFGSLIAAVSGRIGDKTVISVHCHNDLGLAVANSLAAVANGAGQVECTINGIGERAGNCSMEEVVMALKTRKDFFKAATNINTKEIVRTSRLVSKITGIPVQPNKAIVGANAFAHESGIHQDGLLKEKTTYEIMRPEEVGLQSTKLVMGKHSGRHAFKTRLKELGFALSQEESEALFERFKRLADQKKDIFDEDLEALVLEATARPPELFKLVDLSITSGLNQKPTATVKMKVGEEIFDRMEHGDGPVDATYRAIVAISDTKSTLRSFDVKSITGGTDALGEVSVSLEEDGRVVRGNGADTDIIVAAAKAYIDALNKLAVRREA
jgi:2-isopropylmalate synthase